jgi:hypothetical protein
MAFKQWLKDFLNVGTYDFRRPSNHYAQAFGELRVAEPEDAENRRQHRQRVLKGASILSGITNSEVKCTIRNMHKDGAELKISIYSQVPPEFLLYVPVDGIAYRSVVRWRKEDRIGVQFTGTEPKPSWHYG